MKKGGHAPRCGACPPCMLPPEGGAAAADVGRPHVRAQRRHAHGVLRAAVNYAFAPPVGKVVAGRRPAGVVVCAEAFAAEPVVAAEYVQPAVKDMGFAVGDVYSYDGR